MDVRAVGDLRFLYPFYQFINEEHNMKQKIRPTSIRFQGLELNLENDHN